jgi:GINS complex subunit 4
MVDTPDVNSAIFCRVLRDAGNISIDGTGVDFELRRGDVYVVRWSAVKEKVLAGDVELI